MDSAAGWRQEPLSHSDVLHRMIVNRRKVCPLLEAPFVKSRIFRMDWLHVCDIGITQDFLGNLLHEMLPLFNGNNKHDRCATVYAEIEAQYDLLGTEDRLDCLLPTMFEHKDGPYKLRCSAAKARALVPILWTLAEEVLDLRIPKFAAMRQAAYHLDQVYRALASDHPSPGATMKEHGLKFAVQYVALHDFCNPTNTYSWRIKPKLHLFLHIVSDGTVPSRTWTYRDEDFGGSVARMARRRGNLLDCRSTSMNVLSRFKMLNPCVRLM